MTYYVGIDPGLSGAVAFLGPDGKLSLHRTPVFNPDGKGKGSKRKFDLNAMRGLLEWEEDPRRIALAVIELVGPMPGQGITSIFNFGDGYGCWRGLLCGLKIPFQAATPQAWKRVILGGTKRDKQAAIELISHRFPVASLLATPRSRTPHDGFADAACLALYAQHLANGRQ